MAAVTRVKVKPVSPPGFEYANTPAEAKVALLAGDIVTISPGDTPKLGFPFVVKLCTTAEAKTAVKKYVALTPAKAGAVANLGDDVELDGYSGLTPGDPLYFSASVAGGIDTTALTVAVDDDNSDTLLVPLAAKMWALTATRIRFRL